MSPRLATQNRGYSGSVDTILIRDISMTNSTCDVYAPNFAHVIGGEFGEAVSFSTSTKFGVVRKDADCLGEMGNVCGTVGAAALGFHVCDVVSLSTNEEVVWIDAVANVAMVADQEPLGDWTNESFVGPAMGTMLLAVPKESVAIDGQGSIPEPTAGRATGSVNVGHESFGGVSYSEHVITSHTGDGRASGDCRLAGALCTSNYTANTSEKEPLQ